MKRGEIWTMRASGSYLEKPRSAVIMQVNKISESESVVICLFTSYGNTGLSTRVKVLPSNQNGLTKTSYIMVEKIVSVKQSELGEKIGELEDEYLKAASAILKDLLGF